MEVKNNPFYELRSRLYASAAAGCSLISEDFRLQRAIDAFKPMAETNKVFARLYNMCSSLSKSAQAAAEIADCIALADALAVTQGTFADHSETTPAEPNSGIIPASIPYLQLTGYQSEIRKCRYTNGEFDEQFYENIHDPRLLNTFLELAGSQSNNVDYIVADFMDAYGEALVMPLLSTVNFSNPHANGQQINYISRIAGAKQNQLYVSIAENEENPQAVRVAAIKAMSCSIENEDLLFKFFQTEKGKIKTTALWTLASLGSEKADEPLRKILSKTKESETDVEIVAASCGSVCLEYLSQRIDDHIKHDTQLNNVIDMLHNKADAFDCYIKIAEHMIKTCAENKQPQYRTQVNQTLVNTISCHKEPEYRALIMKLYEAIPAYFYPARAFIELLEHPASACTTMNDGNQEHIYDMLLILDSIYYHKQGIYKLSYKIERHYYQTVFHEDISDTIFDSIPDDIIKFLTDTTGIHEEICTYECNDEYQQLLRNANCRIDILQTLLNKCLPTDRERILTAASEYAWTVFNSEAKFNVLSFLIRCSQKPLNGVIKNCVYTALKYNGSSIHIPKYWYQNAVLTTYFFSQFDQSEELLIAELQELEKEILDWKDVPIDRRTAQLDIIYKVLGKHGIVYAGEKHE